MKVPLNIAAVIIGRNEGERFLRCLASVKSQVDVIVYVDSGSADGSIEAAVAGGADVVTLETTRLFTAARARNAGLERVLDIAPSTMMVQFIDGDCELQPGWISKSAAFLQDHPKAAVACGRLRERFPEASVYNWLLDAEWNTALGRVQACGGIALMRVAALKSTGSFNPDLIAGEEPELCVRLRADGWEVWRLDCEMALHDAAMMRFGQWWQRMRRGGYAFAEGMAMHGRPPERHCVKPMRRLLLWGILLPFTIVFGTIFTPWALLLLLAWPSQVLRLWLQGTHPIRAIFLTLSKFPEALGALTYWWRSLTRRQARLIEYK